MHPTWPVATALLLAGCAAHRPPAGLPVPPPAGPIAELYATTEPGALFEEALRAREDGDLDGALNRLAWLAANSPTDGRVVYQLGVTLELRGELRRALATYDRILALDRSREVQRDAGFRRVLVLDDLDRPRQALRSLRRLPGTGVLDPHDRYTFDIERRILDFRIRPGRRHERALAELLQSLEGSTSVTWMRGRGWYVLVRADLRSSRRPAFDGGRRAVRRAMERRARLIASGERRLLKLVRLAEPDWILPGMLELGNAYAALHRDMLAAPPPGNLGPEALAIYQRELEQAAAPTFRKAVQAYDQGLQLASRLGVHSPVVGELRERRDSLVSPRPSGR